MVQGFKSNRGLKIGYQPADINHESMGNYSEEYATECLNFDNSK